MCGIFFICMQHDVCEYGYYNFMLNFLFDIRLSNYVKAEKHILIQKTPQIYIYNARKKQ